MCAPMMALGVLGGAVSAAGSMQAGNAQAQQYEVKAQEAKAEAQLKRRQVELELVSSQQQQRRGQEKLTTQIGQQINQFSAAGVSMEGSPTDVVMDTTRETYLDIAAIEWNAQLKAGNLEYGAKIDDMNAENAKRAAKTAKKTGQINAISGLVGAFSKLGG